MLRQMHAFRLANLVNVWECHFDALVERRLEQPRPSPNNKVCTCDHMPFSREDHLNTADCTSSLNRPAPNTNPRNSGTGALQPAPEYRNACCHWLKVSGSYYQSLHSSSTSVYLTEQHAVFLTSHCAASTHGFSMGEGACLWRR